MQKPTPFFLSLFLLFAGCSSPESKSPDMLGMFDLERDLLLAQFDCKTDVDDLHSVAALGTLLKDERFAQVNYHAVAGTYGIQEGLYVPPNELFEVTFKDHWSDAHTNREQALAEVSTLVSEVLKNGGKVWIAEGGQSDFSADLVRNIQKRMPDINTKEHFHIVQHSDWNEEVTGEENLAFAKANTTYHKIDDGNSGNNGTPLFRSETSVDWQSKLTNAQTIKSWNMAISIGNQYNGQEGRYENKAITQGGLDFSDHSEVIWIFGFEGMKDYDAFFNEFGRN